MSEPLSWPICQSCGADGTDEDVIGAWSEAHEAWLCETCLAEAQTLYGSDGEYRKLAEAFAPWAELREQEPPEPPWVLEGYLARGAVTLIAGKPKAGKSTLACAVAEAVDTEAESFLGCKVHGGPVIYVSEEGAGTLVPKLGTSTRSLALTRHAAWPKPSWVDVISAAVERAKMIGAILLVIDSLSFWASFREGQAKDSGAAQEAMDALLTAAKADLAIKLVHHQRKAAGEEGDAIRDSSAILGTVDIAVELERLGEGASPTQRRLVAMSRYASTPSVLVVERNTLTGTWQLIGQVENRSDAASLGVRERIFGSLSAEAGQTEDELAELIGIDKRKLSDDLRALVRDGSVRRTGAGKKGDPYRYQKLPRNAAPGGAESLAEMLPRPIGRAASAEQQGNAAPEGSNGRAETHTTAADGGREAR